MNQKKTVSSIYRLHDARTLIIYDDGTRSELQDYDETAATVLGILRGIQNGETPATDEAKEAARRIVNIMQAEEEQRKTNEDNRAHCKRIADDIERIISGGAYKCPHCGMIIEKDEDTENDNEDGETCYICPECGKEIEDGDLDEISLYDYFDDGVYNIDYIVDSNKEYQSARIMVSCGGPNIYIDTDKQAVCLYWWSDRAQYYLSRAATDAVDEFAREMYEC